MSIRITLLCTFLLVSNTNAFAAGEGDLEHQSCSGSIIRGDEGYQLEPDAGSEPWCNSAIPQALLQKVLRTCAVGSRCHIDGSVHGHGLFEWYRIRSVTR